MAAELGFHYSFTNLAEISQKNLTQNRLNSDMPPPDVDDDDSWEVRAFAEDTANVMGTTWPPRSYTCTYCRREFRSAQALGGHMNVHRRDRARLHQAQPKPAASFIIPPPDFVSNGGLCLLYQFPNPNDGGINIQSPSALLSMSHRSLNNFISSSSPAMFFPANDPPASAAAFSQPCYGQADQQVSDEQVSAPIENGLQELDLELRLGLGPSTAGAAAEKKEKICNMEAACLRKRSN